MLHFHRFLLSFYFPLHTVGLVDHVCAVALTIQSRLNVRCFELKTKDVTRRSTPSAFDYCPFHHFRPIAIPSRAHNQDGFFHWF